MTIEAVGKNTIKIVDKKLPHFPHISALCVKYMKRFTKYKKNF